MRYLNITLAALAFLMLTSCGKRVVCAIPKAITISIVTADTANYKSANIVRYKASSSNNVAIDSQYSIALTPTGYGTNLSQIYLAVPSAGYNYVVTLYPSGDILQVASISYDLVYTRDDGTDHSTECNSNINFKVNDTAAQNYIDIKR